MSVSTSPECCLLDGNHFRGGLSQKDLRRPSETSILNVMAAVRLRIAFLSAKRCFGLDYPYTVLIEPTF